LLNFTAAKASNGAQIAWKTENEQNYTNFTVERSTNGGATFNDLGNFVSSSVGTYSFLDGNPPIAADRYRLKIVDLNGAITYSNVVTLIYGNGNNITAGNISVYPNPASDVINLAINQGSTTSVGSLSASQPAALTPGLNQGATSQSYGIKIISITGSVITSVTSSSANWQNSVSDLAPGTYIIQVVNNSNNSLVGRSTFVKL
jgi:trimeric autotransporter adhesin